MSLGSANISLNPFYSNKIILFAVLTSILFFAASIILVIANFFQLPPEIPIFYSAKTQILGKKIFILIMPTIIFLNLVINLVLSKIFFVKRPFLAKILVVVLAIVSFLVFWAQTRIMLLF